MVVVDPDEVPRDVPHDLDDDVGECLVRFYVSSPQICVESPGTGGRQRHQVVQERPQLLLAEFLVVALPELCAQKDGAAAEAGVQFQGDDFLFRRGNVIGGEASHVEDIDVVSHALLFRGVLVFFQRKEVRRKERERRSRSKKKERAKRGGEKALNLSHRRLRDQRVLVPLELPFARRGRGALHLDGQVVGDEDEAVGVKRKRGEEVRERERWSKGIGVSVDKARDDEFSFSFARLSLFLPVEKSHAPFAGNGNSHPPLRM